MQTFGVDAPVTDNQMIELRRIKPGRIMKPSCRHGNPLIGQLITPHRINEVGQRPCRSLVIGAVSHDHDPHPLVGSHRRGRAGQLVSLCGRNYPGGPSLVDAAAPTYSVDGGHGNKETTGTDQHDGDDQHECGQYLGVHGLHPFHGTAGRPDSAQ